MINDPHFPQLPDVINSEQMRRRLSALVSERHSGARRTPDIIDCRIGEKRHKPGKSFVCTYLVRLRDPQTGELSEQILGARLESGALEGASQSVHLNAYEDSGGAFPPVAHLDDVGMTLWAFPYDRKLVYLHRLFDKAYVRRILCSEQIVPPIAGERDRAMTPEVLHYVPERSCMVRFRLVANEAEGQSKRETTVYAKNYRGDEGASVYAVMQQLHKQGVPSARPLYYDLRTRTLWQSHVRGEPVSWAGLRGETGHAHIKKAAQAIGAFHTASIHGGKSYRIKDILCDLQTTIDIAALQRPACAPRVKRLVERLAGTAAAMASHSRIHTPIHRDLKMQNLLLEACGGTLIDLDEVCEGHPLSDVGSFITSLYLNAIREGVNDAEVKCVVEAFFAEYCARVPWCVSRAVAHWYIAAAFVHESVRRSLRQQDSERMRNIDAYLTLSECHLD